MTTSIRPVTKVEECLYFQELERRVWDTPEIDVMPIHTLITCIKNGGLILGAFDEAGPPEMGSMVGATYGWPGVVMKNGEQRVKFCSHMAGVLNEWQGKGIGLQLKLAQRKAVLDLGYTDWISWTYDPLYRVNGVLNIHRLGAVCNTYYRNTYGEMLDGLNRGVPSDRCQVDWWLRSERVVNVAELDHEIRRRETGKWGDGEMGRVLTRNTQHATRLLQILPTQRSGDFYAPVEVDLRVDGSPIALPVPDDIAAIRRSDGGFSLAWRMYMRSVLETAFAAGYAMVDCVRIGHEWYYVVELPL